MKKKDDLLDDIEDFINCDWKEVHDNFKKEEYKKEISEPVIPDFPVYREFYDLMVELTGDPHISPRLDYLIHRFVRNRENKLNSGFERIWEFFTSPRQYRVHEERCQQCRKKWHVVSKPSVLPRVSFDPFSSEQTMQYTSEVVACPHCSRPLVNIAGEVVGVFK